MTTDSVCAHRAAAIVLLVVLAFRADLTWGEDGAAGHARIMFADNETSATDVTTGAYGSEYWRVAGQHKESAVHCVSDDAVVAFLGQVEVGRGDAEFGEYVSEVIESLLQNQPACLLRGIRRLDESKRRGVLEKLRFPLFLGEEEVRRILEPALQRDDPLWLDLKDVLNQ